MEMEMEMEMRIEGWREDGGWRRSKRKCGLGCVRLAAEEWSGLLAVASQNSDQA